MKKLEHLQNISENKKEFRDSLTARGVPDAICDLLFEKYVAKKGLKRTGSGGSNQRPVKRGVMGAVKFFTTLTDCEVSGRVYRFRINTTDASGKRRLYVRDCYDPLYDKVLKLAQDHDGVIVTGSSGVGKGFLGVSD